MTGRKETQDVLASILGLGLVLLPPWRRDLAFDREGDAVGAWYTKASCIASNLQAVSSAHQSPTNTGQTAPTRQRTKN